MSSSISERIVTIRSSLPTSVKLIAVSKQVPVQFIRSAYAAGIRDFAESRIQEAASKQAELQDLPDITWHFIGHLQSNKARILPGTLLDICKAIKPRYYLALYWTFAKQ